MGLIKWQHEHDRERKTYKVVFPNPLPVEDVRSLLHALSTSLYRGLFDDFTGRQTIVFEAWAAGTGISYRVLIPEGVEDRIKGEFMTLIPGTVLEEDMKRPRLAWDDVAEISLSDNNRTINADNTMNTANDILSNLVQALNDKECAVIQWVLAPASYIAPPSLEGSVISTRRGWLSLLLNEMADRDEVLDRRKKLEQPCYQLVGRVAARAKDQDRAKHLVTGLMTGIRTANGAAYFKTSRSGQLDVLRDRVNYAATPLRMPVVLNVSELTAVLGLPLGSPSVPGLPRTIARTLFATEEVPRIGRHLGIGNFNKALKRAIAQTYGYPVHTYVGGGTGTGKSVLLANSAAQDMEQGCGVIVIDASNSNSPETVFNRVLNYVPYERMNEVVVMDVAAGVDRPVGFNLLDQSDPHMVATQLTALLESIYPDSKGVWTKPLIFHGIHALSDYGEASITDLQHLIRPKPEQLPWMRAVIKSIKDKYHRDFWEDWMAKKEEERERRSQPLWDRLWELNSRPEIRNILGQTKSAFDLKDVLANNKILFINLAGLPEDTSGLIATAIFQKAWELGQTLKPDKPNFFYLDEVQQMTRVNVNLDDIMARGRKHNFFLTTATQHLKGSKISDETRTAIVNNTGTKILFTSSAEEAKFWLPEFGGRMITENEITGLKRYDAIAKIGTETSPGDPVTFTAAAPFKSNGTAELVKKLSAERFGTPLDEVEKQIEARTRIVKADEAEERPAMATRKIA